MRIYGPQPEGYRNASEPYQYQLLRDETASLYGKDIVAVQGQQCAGIPFCPQRADKAAVILCKFGTGHRNPHKIFSCYQILKKAMSGRNSLA